MEIMNICFIVITSVTLAVFSTSQTSILNSKDSSLQKSESPLATTAVPDLNRTIDETNSPNKPSIHGATKSLNVLKQNSSSTKTLNQNNFSNNNASIWNVESTINEVLNETSRFIGDVIGEKNVTYVNDTRKNLYNTKETHSSKQFYNISLECSKKLNVFCCRIDNLTIKNSSIICQEKTKNLTVNCNNSAPTKNCSRVSKKKHRTTKSKVMKLEIAFLLLINAILFIVGVTGNTMIVLAILTKKSLQNLQNYFVFNLAITDLFTLIVYLPYSTKNLFDSIWPFGSIACSYLLPFLDIVPSVSVLTMVAISIDRYRAITRAMSHTLAIKSTVFLLIILWVVCYLIVAFPVSFFMTLTKDGECKPKFTSIIFAKAYYTARFVLLYVLPCLSIFVCYLRVNKALWNSMRFLQRSVTGKSQIISLKRQKHVMSMFFVIFITFAVCFLPFNVIVIIFNFASIDILIKSKKFMVHAMRFAEILCISNSVCNPLILYSLSKTYRDRFQHYLPFLKWCSTKNKELPDDHPATTARRISSLNDHDESSFDKTQSYRNRVIRFLPFSAAALSPRMKWMRKFSRSSSIIEEQDQSKELIQTNKIKLQEVGNDCC